MTGASWGAAALAMLHLTGAGALPKEVTVHQVAPYAAGQPVRVLVSRGSDLRSDKVELIPLESYLAGVVAAEMPSSFPLEAMKAQAIAARTYTLFHLGDHASQGADLCGEVHCQAFHGVPSPDSKAYRAAQETAGEVLVYRGVLLDAQYSAACSGHTVAAWDTRQGKLLPYLCGASDRGEEGAYCAQGHNVNWTKRFTSAEAQHLISRNLKIVLGDPTLAPGKLLSLRLAARAGNRVRWFEVKTTTGTYRVLGDSVRWLFGTGLPGPSGLRSTRFDLKVRADKRGRPQSYLFTGAGHGHAIGMCQWGARGRALAGQTAVEILEAYYPGAEVWNLR
jgi:stage II sporulation protein D